MNDINLLELLRAEEALSLSLSLQLACWMEKVLEVHGRLTGAGVAKPG